MFETDDRVRYDVTCVVEAVVSSISAQAPAVSFRTDLPESAPVLAHPRIETAISELLENAVEHNDTTSLTVDVTVTPAVERASGVQLCCIEIRDTGQGIPRHEVEALTQPEETPLSHGRGLGLWLVSAITEQSGGLLEFADADQGTTVRLWLPRAQSPPATSATAAGTEPLATESE